MLGFESSSTLASNADSSLDLLAGSHPYALTTTFKLNTTTNSEGRLVPQGGDLKDLVAELPPGLTVNPLAIPRCGAGEFATVNSSTDEDGCPNASSIGVVAVENLAPTTLTERKVSIYPLYDLTPPIGSAALFGFMVGNRAVYLTPSVRTGGDYGLTVAMTGMPQDVHVFGSTVTFWGVPAESGHDTERGDCVQSLGTCPAGLPPRPFLTLPTQCITPPTVSLRADSWQEPGQFSALASDPITGGKLALTACEALDFSPSFHAQVESTATDAPTGLKVSLHLPQSEEALGLAEAELEEGVVTLPPGMTLNLSRVGTLLGCPLEGPEGIDLSSSEPAHCPEASKIGSVRIKAPFLPEELQGSVYVAQQGNLPGNGTNPFKSLIAIYIFAEASGVVVKLPGEVSANPGTGQLTMHIGPDPVTGEAFAPQLPFEDIELEFSGGSEGDLVTPTTCGSYATSAALAPWSGAAPAALADELSITQGCTNGFNPSLSADTVDKQAGGFSTFTTTLARRDGEQEIKGMSLTTPSGLQGTLKGVTLCPEPQASLGTCGAQSLIGEATSSVGAGPDPFAIKGGKVYLTGPHGGGPFGLSLVVPAVAGPFNLGPEGHPLVIRAAIQVDPITAQNTIVTDAAGPYSIPSILEGFVPQIKSVNITINRPDFIFNPTTCAAQSITGVITSAQGQTANVSTPFQATNCASLPFSPKLRASTVGRPSRTNGIGFNVKIVQGVAGEANAQSVKVDLPKQLPSRLTTLQKACRASVFQSNPASCPAGSIVGTAIAVTPILPVPMAGPAYFVSHGGAKFPELVIVLQGYGVTIDLYGETFISKAGITSSTFSRIPDAPVSSFELHLPAGKDSALTAHNNLCTSDLRTPTLIVAQNGAVVKEDPKIAVSGCRPAIKVVRHRVRGNVAMILVSVPSAGKLRASGDGLSRATRKLERAGTVMVRLTLSKSKRRLLAHRRGRGLRIAVKLLFVPSHGGRLSGHVTVLVR
ncbi:MAG: hypothetical protein WAN93_14235 [Solirubrobacteraceae bacterium]